MSNSKRSPTIATDLYKQQEGMIKELREENTRLKITIDSLEQENAILNQKIPYYKEVQQELIDLKSKLGKNPQLYSQIVQPPNPQQDYMMLQEQKRKDYERQARIEASRAAKHDEEIKQVLEENPAWKKNADDAKARVEQQKEYMLKKADDFYCLDEQDVKQYINLPHRPEESAIKHMIEEVTEVNEIGEKRFSYYRCGYCMEEYTTLFDIERHQWLEGDSHHDKNMDRIEKDAQDSIAKINANLRRDVEQEIKDKADREYKAREAKRRAEQSKLKSTLPFVNK